jgi:hypothetical protein
VGLGARDMLSMPRDPKNPQEGRERLPNGLVKPSDESKERIFVPAGGSITLGRPLPSREELKASIKGLGAKAAFAKIQQFEIESGDLVDILEKRKAMAKGGDWRAIEDYIDRFVGKAPQTIEVSQEVRHTLAPEDRKVLTDLRDLFGMAKSLPAGVGVEVVATVEAKEVA